MPTYVYQCKKCKGKFEKFQKISEPPIERCPNCKGKVKRLISAAAFALKGEGWYKNGYSKSKEKKGEKKNEAPKHEETKKT